MKYWILPAIVFSLNVQAEEFHAAEFIEQQCAGCHGSEVYSRPDHKMQDLDQLTRQVKRCDANLGTTLFDDQIEALTNYLNDTYYKF